ncbi:cation:proton antiporter [Umboniibacter marinipuniceus]|uniref:Kef-type potassium/proton antiporter (CPA2 family) n=1 Tax=Umboniibacter marinipuniceus TaxID=569599 RepID=A0A3M0AE61_9GAMM|nr:cation:proton antiporter [Umboniibacter marinipuniceus]RMA82424.1 Kef-type potassium/proton antiporter (CPA2 family) [Umboniibacter marinipuniceus]
MLDTQYFDQLLIILAAALASAVIFRRLYVPSIVAYLVAGAVIGPSVMGWIDEPQQFSFLAEFGVVFLLFALGLEFSVPKLLRLKGPVFGVGSAQVLLCMLIFGSATYLWGASVESAFVIAGALALSSTAIVTKELSTLGEVHTDHGRLSIGVLLFQDLVAVVLLIVIPVLGASSGADLGTALGVALVKGLLLAAILLAVGRWVLPIVYREVAKSQSSEIFVLSTLVIVMVAAWVTHAAGLSMALGAFVTGMMLGECHYKHQIESDIRGFRDILLGLFFVTVGMNVDASMLVEYAPRIILFTLALVALKALIIAVLIRLLGYPAKPAAQSGLILSEAGEFGLALLTIAVSYGLLPNEQASFIMIVAVLSMALSPFLIRYGHHVVARWLKPSKLDTDDGTTANDQEKLVLVGGYGRVGKAVVRLLALQEVPYLVIERDPEVVAAARKQGIRITYGDCTEMSILSTCGIGSARLALLSFDTLDHATEVIEHIRSADVTTPLMIRLPDSAGVDELIALGANHLFPEMVEATISAVTNVSTLLSLDDTLTQQLENELRSEGL